MPPLAVGRWCRPGVARGGALVLPGASLAAGRGLDARLDVIDDPGEAGEAGVDGGSG
jgi:hypothetical protein